MNVGTNIIGYARVSSTEQAANGYGLDAQEQAIRDECRRRDWTLVEVVRDEGLSGRTTRRPGLQRALTMIAEGEAAGLVVAKLDRMSRSVIDVGFLLEWFQEMSATLVALDFGLDLSTPSGRLVANVLASVGEWEADVISARTRDGLAEARRQGRPISRPATRDDAQLRRRIVRMHARGLSAHAIARALNAAGVPTVRGGRQWRQSSVQSVLGYQRPKARRQPPELPATRRQRASRIKEHE